MSESCGHVWRGECEWSWYEAGEVTHHGFIAEYPGHRLEIDVRCETCGELCEDDAVTEELTIQVAEENLREGFRLMATFTLAAKAAQGEARR